MVTALDSSQGGEAWEGKAAQNWHLAEYHCYLWSWRKDRACAIMLLRRGVTTHVEYHDGIPSPRL